MIRITAAVTLLASFIQAVCAPLSTEYIPAYTATITLQNDRSIVIQEQVTFVVEHQRIKRGITRTFPTVYSDGFVLRRIADVDIIAVTRNGNPEPYHVETGSQGKRILVGTDRYIEQGEQTYCLTYRVQHQVHPFMHDDKKVREEFAYTLPGTDNPFPIKNLTIKVVLPEDYPLDALKTVAWRGNYGSLQTSGIRQSYRNATLTFGADNIGAQQSVTIALAMPTGKFAPITSCQAWLKVIHDNLDMVLALLCFIISLTLIGYQIYQAYQQRNSTVIIPRFELPEDINAGQARALYRLSYDNNSLAAYLVQLAVQGIIKIEQVTNKNWFSASDYKITDLRTIATQETQKINKTSDDKLLDTLFKGEQSIVLSSLRKNNTSQGSKVISKFESLFITPFLRRIYDSKQKSFLAVFIPSIILYLTAEGFIAVYSPYTSLMPALILGGITFLLLVRAEMANCFTRFKPTGIKAYAHILGLRMFLKVAEEERLKRLIDTSSAAHVYEQYLPYAIALGVERQWTTQLQPYLQATASNYHPNWYHGDTDFSTRSFSSNWSSAISRSTTAPGSRSSFDSSGDSGGVGSGGGGGGFGGH